MARAQQSVLRVLTAVTALLLVTAACGDDGPAGAPGTDTTRERARATSTSERNTTTSTSLPGGDLAACENPEGFTISAPVDWATNAGDVVPACSQFNPDPFDVPRGTDERVAAITAYVDPVPFLTAARPDENGEEDRAVTTIDGRQAVRISGESSGEGLFPAGTPMTSYLIDVTPEGGEPATLFVNTIGTAPFDYDTNAVVLDRMARTIVITDPAVDTDPATIATYVGGGGGFSATAESIEDEVCLRIPPNGEPVCTAPPAGDQVNTITLQDLDRPVPSGVTGAHVWRIDLVTPEGMTHSYLPVPVPGADVGAYAFAESVKGFERVVLFDVTGEELRTVERRQS